MKSNKIIEKISNLELKRNYLYRKINIINQRIKDLKEKLKKERKKNDS